MAKPSKPSDYGVEADTVLLGKYKINAILGHGGMGIVALATHIQLEEKVAIKFLRDDVTLDDETMRRFLREAQNAVKLKSEHVARVTDVGTFESGTPYMVMEYLEGIDLGQMLQESGKINPSLAVELLIQACVALAEAHSLGIVHRDIKPGNLFVTWRADGSPLLKILDFGISKAPIGADMNLTQTQSLLGTPAYMSPEQMRSARTVDPRSDIWSLGTVLYEIIQGRRPFEAESFSEMCVKVAVDPPAPLTVAFPPGLDKVILRALEKDQTARYQTIAEMARDLAPFARDRNSALVAVERMTRMLGRSRASFDRDASSPEAIPRGMLRDAKSQPVAVPTFAKDAASAPHAIGASGSVDTGNLGVGDTTDHDMSLDGNEATAITTLDATRTKITAAPDDGGPDTDRRRVPAADSSSHRTIEEDLSAWSDGKSPWTPQTTTAQTGATTDPSLPEAELPPEAAAAAKALAEANAAAAAKVHTAAQSLAAKKALKPQTSGQIPRAGSGTIPHGSNPSSPAPPAASSRAQPLPLAATLPGLFPLALPNRPSQPRPTPVHGVSALGAAPSLLAKGAPAAARPTAPVVDLRPSRMKWLGLMLALGVGIGIAVFVATRDDPTATTPPVPVVDPAPTDPAPTAPALAPVTPPAIAPDLEPPVAPTTQDLAPPPTPPLAPPPPAGEQAATPVQGDPVRPGGTVAGKGKTTGKTTGRTTGKTTNKTTGGKPTQPGTGGKPTQPGTGAGSGSKPPAEDPFARRVLTPTKKPR